MSFSRSAFCRNSGAAATKWLGRFLAWAGFALVGPYAIAQQGSADMPAPVANRYPAGSIKSVAEADKALTEVARERAEVEARYSAEEQACHPKFFASSCIEEAKERRRKATMQLRAVEIEANTVKRRARVTARDAALEERQAKDAVERAERLKQPEGADDAAATQEKTTEVKKEESGRKKTTIFPDRQKRHDAKLEQLKAEQAADAKKRAESVAAYEKKVQDAKARQQAVADRKAEKERKRQKRAASGEAK